MKKATKEHPGYKFQRTDVGNLYEFSCENCEYKYVVDKQKLTGLLANIGESLTRPGGPMEKLGRVVKNENERKELLAAIQGAKKHFSYCSKCNLWLCPTCSKNHTC